MKRTLKFLIINTFIISSISMQAQNVSPFELTDTWLAKIEKISPSSANNNTKQKILIFSLHTGFKHWTIPHTEAVMKLLAEKSGRYTVELSKDILSFNKKNLKQFDAIILNNNCSVGDFRNLFYDKLKENKNLSQKEIKKRALKLENNLLNFVKKGGGLMALHGAIVMQNKSKNFGEMIGGSFDYHPKQQNIDVKLSDVNHPILKGFKGKGFTHFDEPYFFNNAYFDYNFKPLLYMETNKLDGLKEKAQDKIKYISWIKKYGKGRVFYSSPSHNAQSFENAKLLEFFTNGMHYVTGNLDCDDSPMQ